MYKAKTETLAYFACLEADEKQHVVKQLNMRMVFQLT